MANTQISEKLSSLCGETPTLNIFESGLDDLNFDSSNINPNFRLFIIYNPSAQNAKKIDQSLFNKCIKFTLPSIDSSPRDATTMLYESISNNSNIDDFSLWSNLSARIAKYHIEETKKSKENTDLVAGNVPFTSRNLYFISNDFHKTFDKLNPTVESWLQSIFDNYYWRSFINYSQKERKKLIENTLNIIKAVPDQQYKVDKELDFNEEFKEIVEDLISIQAYAAKNIEYRDFFFVNFLQNCLLVPINKDKLESLYNNLEDTILLLDNNEEMDEMLKNKFYQILFIKNNYENLLNNFENVSGFEDKLELINEQLLKNNDIKLYLLRMRFLYQLLKQKNNNIYESNINYKLFNPYSNELSKKLLDLIQHKNKRSFEDLIIFLFENPDSFKIIDNYYPYNNNELKEGELKYANYYIYLWHNLFMKKFNFSVRFGEHKYYIIFPNEEQDGKLTSYFILNEKKSLIMSKDSYLKLNTKNNNSYTYNYSYVDNPSEENTKNFIQWTFNNYNRLFKESSLKTFKEIDDLQLESYNFFTNNSSSLISRIWSLLINLTDKYSNVLSYFLKSFCFLEKDVIEIFQFLYNNLEANHLNDIINNMKIISFFCDSESILWKYRNLINNFQKDIEININENYNYFNELKIDADEEIELIKKEIENINKLNIYWDDRKLDNYKGKLLTLQNLLILYKNKGIEDAEISKLRSDASSLLLKLEQKTKQVTSSKLFIFLKKEINNFSNNPTQELLKILHNKVDVFLNLIDKKDKNKLDTINFPNKNNIDMNIDMKKYQLYEYIFWFSFIDDGLNQLLDPETDEKTYMELSMDLYKDADLEPIITFINEKKIRNK